MLPTIVLFAIKYLPAVGLLGKAAYSALSLHDLPTAGQDIVNAAAVFGLSLHGAKAATSSSSSN
jgi:hypothetical protein